MSPGIAAIALGALPLAGWVLAQSVSQELDRIENLVIGSTGLVAVAIPAILVMWRALNSAQQHRVEEMQRTIERLQREVDLCRPSYVAQGPAPYRPQHPIGQEESS
ncbi:MAG: hypothetical protein ACKOWF_01970 [Chloroflexota bacterium]